MYGFKRLEVSVIILMATEMYTIHKMSFQNKIDPRKIHRYEKKSDGTYIISSLKLTFNPQFFNYIGLHTKNYMKKYSQ